MAKVYVIELGGWSFYESNKGGTVFSPALCGKWMYFYDDEKFAERICYEAVADGIVKQAKHSSNSPNGVCCFYLEIDDTEGHKRVLDFFLRNNLIRRTKAGKLYNISFKLDQQTDAGQYGNQFKSQLKLSDFVNLETGEFLV